MLELTDIHKSWPGPGGNVLNVLKGLSLKLVKGSCAAIVGPSGCGKSTLLNIAGAIERPDSGSVSIAGHDINALDDDQLARIRNRQVGFVFQLHHLLGQFTLLENVLIPVLADKKADVKSARDRARKLLDYAGLTDWSDHLPGQLSGGQLQRAAVVRALINRPAVVLADEPTGMLDAASAENIFELLRDINRNESTTLLVVTHSMKLAATMDRVFRLEDGVLTEEVNV